MISGATRRASVTNQDESTSVTSVSPSSDILTTGVSRKRKYTVAGLLGEVNEKMDYKSMYMYLYKPWTIAHGFPKIGFKITPQFLLHFLIHIDVLMLCRIFELIPT